MVGALATVLSAACGNGGGGAVVDEPVSTEGPGSAGTEAAGDTTVRPCFVLTQAEVEALLGAPITAGPNPYGGTGGCGWVAQVEDEDKDISDTRTVDLQVHEAATSLEEVLTLDGQPSTVPDLGEQALVETSSSGPPAVMVAFRTGQRVVSLRYQVESMGTATLDPRSDPAPVLDTARALAGHLADPQS